MPARSCTCAAYWSLPTKVPPTKAVGISCADAVGALLIGDADAQLLGLELQFLLENKLVEHLLRVERLQRRRDRHRSASMRRQLRANVGRR